MILRSAAVAAGLALGSMSGAAQAAYTFKFTETAQGVLQTGSGSLDVGDLVPFFPFSVPAGITPSSPAASAGNSPSVDGANADTYFAVFTSATPFGTGPTRTADSATGATVGFDTQGFFFSGFIFVPNGYTSGDSLGTSTALYSGQTFSSLGLTPGTQTYGYTSSGGFEALSLRSAALAFEPAEIDSITVQVGTVPLPASAPMFGAALLGLAGLGYAAKRKTAASAA